MADYISREEAINAIKSLESSMPAKDNYAKGYDAALGRVLIAVREVPPAADVQPKKHGRWIFTEKLILGNPYGSYKCSKCMYHVPHEDNYCPNCGARMDGDTDNNMRNLTDEETSIYESWIESEAKDVQPSPKWISVKDRLPENCIEVLVYDTDCGIVIGWYDKEIGDFAADFISPLDAVTHWQPIPEPPVND